MSILDSFIHLCGVMSPKVTKESRGDIIAMRMFLPSSIANVNGPLQKPPWLQLLIVCYVGTTTLGTMTHSITINLSM
jgi:hypothetical protein